MVDKTLLHILSDNLCALVNSIQYVLCTFQNSNLEIFHEIS